MDGIDRRKGFILFNYTKTNHIGRRNYLSQSINAIVTYNITLVRLSKTIE